MDDVSIVVCTYGDLVWARTAERVAIPSAEQFGVPVHHVHGDSLDDARNHAARVANSEWLVYLDADDELEDHYFEVIGRATGDVRVPSVRYVEPNRKWPRPRMPRVAGHLHHDCSADCLLYGNWVVVGAAVRRSLILDNPWRTWPCYEDWDLWLRLHQAGATFTRCEAAVYRAHVRPDSRNRGQLTPEEKHAVHQEIARANSVPVPA